MESTRVPSPGGLGRGRERAHRDGMDPRDHHDESAAATARAALIGLLVGASLWIAVAGGLQRTHLAPALLPQAPAGHTTTIEALTEPIPLPGGAGHLLPAGVEASQR